MSAWVLSHFSHVQLFATLWNVACQGPLSIGFLRAKILDWVAVFSSRESSWPRDRTCVSMSSALAGGFFTTSATWEAQFMSTLYYVFLTDHSYPSFLCSSSHYLSCVLLLKSPKPPDSLLPVAKGMKLVYHPLWCVINKIFNNPKMGVLNILFHI